MLIESASPDVHPEETLCETGHIAEKERLAYSK